MPGNSWSSGSNLDWCLVLGTPCRARGGQRRGFDSRNRGTARLARPRARRDRIARPRRDRDPGSGVRDLRHTPKMNNHVNVNFNPSCIQDVSIVGTAFKLFRLPAWRGGGTRDLGDSRTTPCTAFACRRSARSPARQPSPAIFPKPGRGYCMDTCCQQLPFYYQIMHSEMHCD